MVAFVATKSVDMGNLAELGLFSKFSQLNTPSITDSSSFKATKGGVSLFVTGDHMTCILKQPTSGTMDGVTVSVNGQARYAVNNMGLNFGKIQKYFSGNFESKLFKGADLITGSNAADQLQGYNGNDKITARDGNDSVAGGVGNDRIDGSAGNDYLNGNAGNDTLDGGGGKDTLTGGGGRDSFLFDNGLSSRNYDKITDFTVGKDTIELAASVFNGIGSKGVLSSKHYVDASDYAGQKKVIVYFQVTGEIAYDANGGKLKDAVKFAKVTPGLDLEHTDFFVV